MPSEKAAMLELLDNNYNVFIPAFIHSFMQDEAFQTHDDYGNHICWGVLSWSTGNTDTLKFMVIISLTQLMIDRAD